MSFKLVFCLFVLASAAFVCHAQRRYNPYLSSPYYRDQYYRQRDLYNQRRYYDQLYREYNPLVSNAQARVLQQSNQAHTGQGAYSHSYQTENGIQVEEHGVHVAVGHGKLESQVAGAYSYLTPEGLRVSVKYVADANGFRPIITYDGTNAALYANQQAAANVLHARR